MKVLPVSASVELKPPTTVPEVTFSLTLARGKGDVRRSIVLIGDADGQLFFVGEATTVCRADADGVARFGFEVEYRCGVEACSRQAKLALSVSPVPETRA